MMNSPQPVRAARLVLREDARPPAYDAREITNETGLASLMLDGQQYTLRITRQGKLLLTK